jgi:hypothetical protein
VRTVPVVVCEVQQIINYILYNKVKPVRRRGGGRGRGGRGRGGGRRRGGCRGFRPPSF